MLNGEVATYASDVFSWVRPCKTETVAWRTVAWGTAAWVLQSEVRSERSHTCHAVSDPRPSASLATGRRHVGAA